MAPRGGGSGVSHRRYAQRRGADPRASTMDAIKADPENEGALPFLVAVPDPPGRSLRINVTLPEDLIAAIDRTTKNRSRFLAEAARERLARVKV